MLGICRVKIHDALCANQQRAVVRGNRYAADRIIMLGKSSNQRISLGEVPPLDTSIDPSSN
jgi:hypothetical protein